MYTFDSRVRYSETGEDAHLSLDGVINYMQDCSNFQSLDLGVGLDYLQERHCAWILSSWQIVIHRYPEMGEKITIGTQAYKCVKMFGYRNFIIKDEAGETLAIANSLWVLLDSITGRPVKISDKEAQAYGTAEPLEMDYAPRKIKVPDGGSEQKHFFVQEYHLDTNHHVNNGQYVRMAMAFLEKNKEVKQLRVEYKKQAMLGDEIVPVVYNTKQGCLVSLNTTDGDAYAVVEFTVE